MELEPRLLRGTSNATALERDSGSEILLGEQSQVPYIVLELGRSPLALDERPYADLQPRGSEP